MSYHLGDTIAAIASAAGFGARGLVRVSGPNAIRVTNRGFTSQDGQSIDDLQFAATISGHFEIVLVAGTMQRVPCDLLVWPTHRSYTREPVVELHILGSSPLLEAILAAVCHAGARLAEPGEFTLRAFLAGRLDLTQAEAVLGVINARGGDELNAALAQLAGGLARPLQRLRNELLQLLAELEAGLDFVDEDIEFISRDELTKRLAAAVKLLRQLSEQMDSRLAAAGVRQVVLAGPPNAGKSSLFNTIVAHYGVVEGSSEWAFHKAIVSPQPGTTRDYLSAAVDFDGFRCELVDTAGVVTTTRLAGAIPAHGNMMEQLEATAQAVGKERRELAAIRVWCIDASERATLRGWVPDWSRIGQGDVVAWTKSDLLVEPLQAQLPLETMSVVTSSRTGAGLAELGRVLRSMLTADPTTETGQVVATTAQRCSESIRMAEQAICRSRRLVEDNEGEELVAVEIRAALDELGRIVGAVYTDDLLDRIFRSFCIGK
ncbi:MAG: 50S ribosome-binding GTPase [Planctomycetes bacterium]|nr:50S ribosome-binding GTPase [Planctomycetota bacterium]